MCTVAQVLLPSLSWLVHCKCAPTSHFSGRGLLKLLWDNEVGILHSTPGEAGGFPLAVREDLCLSHFFSLLLRPPSTNRQCSGTYSLAQKKIQLRATQSDKTPILALRLRKKIVGVPRGLYFLPRGEAFLDAERIQSWDLREEQEGQPPSSVLWRSQVFLAAESGAEYFILTIIIKVRDRAKTFTLCRLWARVKLGRPWICLLGPELPH